MLAATPASTRTPSTRPPRSTTAMMASLLADAEAAGVDRPSESVRIEGAQETIVAAAGPALEIFVRAGQDCVRSFNRGAGRQQCGKSCQTARVRRTVQESAILSLDLVALEFGTPLD